MQRHHVRFLGLNAIPGAVGSQQSAVSSQRLRFIGLIALLSLILAAPAAGAELKFFHATTAGLALSDNPLDAGQPLTLTGRVTDAQGGPVAAGSVQIQLADAPEGPWLALDEGELDRHGSFEITDRTLGLASRPLYVRARYPGHDTGRVCYGASLSPVVPVIVPHGAARDEALGMGFIEARGNGAPGPGGGGPWEFVIRVRAVKEVSQAVFQGYTSDWVPVVGLVMNFQADAGKVSARNLEDGLDDTLITWRLGRLLAGEEAILKVTVDGVIAETEAECDAVLPLGGSGQASFIAAGGSGRPSALLSEGVSLTLSCPEGE
jgi:hypothetical protein